MRIVVPPPITIDPHYPPSFYAALWAVSESTIVKLEEDDKRRVNSVTRRIGSGFGCDRNGQSGRSASRRCGATSDSANAESASACSTACKLR